MACRALGNLGVLGLGLVLGLAAGGCIEAFDGSNLQIDFSSGVQTSTRPGRNPERFQPPQDTHFELYAADQIYRTDVDGTPVLDDRGQPILEQTFLFKVTEFEIRPVIDVTSPCFIELADTRYPGLHITRFEEHVKEQTGISDPFNSDAPLGDITDVLNAIRRVDNLQSLENALKVVASHEPFRYPATAPAGQCPPAAADALPDPGCRDDVSNAQRLRRCRELWAPRPDFYEGSDKVFTLPLNGSYIGMVTGTNPLNEGFVGGSSFFVDENLVDHDAYLINWQYSDFDGNDEPDFPDDLPVPEQSDTGYTYLIGLPVSVTRGVTTVPLRHPNEPAIRAELSIVPNLGRDDVHF